jgi:hypothetical protein
MLFGAYSPEDLSTTLMGFSGFLPAAALPLAPVQTLSTEFMDITPSTPSGGAPAMPILTKPSGIMGDGLPTSITEPIKLPAFSGRLPDTPITRGSKLQEGGLSLPNQSDFRIVLGDETSPSGRRGYHSPEVWDSYKQTIKSLYLDDGKPLKEVMDIMKQHHGFKAS